MVKKFRSNKKTPDLRVEPKKATYKSKRAVTLSYIYKQVPKHGYSLNKYVRNKKIPNLLKMYRNYRCQYCDGIKKDEDGKFRCHAAHIYPHCITRDNHPENIYILCAGCHDDFDNGSITQKVIMQKVIQDKFLDIKYNKIIHHIACDILMNLSRSS